MKTVSVRSSLLAISLFILLLNQCEEVESAWGLRWDWGWPGWDGGWPGWGTSLVPNIKHVLKKLAEKAVTDSSKAFQDPVTRALCHLKTVYIQV